MGAIGVPLALHAALDGSVVPREAAPRRHAFGLKACGVVGHLLLSHCHNLFVNLFVIEIDAVNVPHARLRAGPTELHLRALGNGRELPFNVSSLSDQGHALAPLSSAEGEMLRHRQYDVIRRRLRDSTMPCTNVEEGARQVQQAQHRIVA